MGNRVVYLLPAAGYSSRMQAFKPLLPLAGQPALAWLLNTLNSLGAEQIDVITGYQAERLEAAISAPNVRYVANPDYAQGMLTSVCAGIRANLDNLPVGFILQPADCPLVPAEVIREILDIAELFPDRFIVPCFKGKKGHPLYVPRDKAVALLDYRGERGLKGFMTPFNPEMIRLDVPHDTILLDMDTPEDYRTVQARVTEILDQKPARPADPIRPDVRRLLFVRHGQIQQHAEPILLGQTDVPLSARGREEACRAGQAVRLRQTGRTISAVITSDLSRTRETAEIVQKEAAETAPLIVDPGLREIFLGLLDGMFVSRFRENWPDEYRRRGEDMLTYRFDPSAEDYADLKHRALAALERIRQNTTGDIVIVTHDGVIKTLFSDWWEVPPAQFLKVRYPTGRLFVREEFVGKEAVTNLMQI